MVALFHHDDLLEDHSVPAPKMPKMTLNKVAPESWFTALTSRLNGLDFLYGRDQKIECFSLTTLLVLIADWCHTYTFLSLEKSPGFKTDFTENSVVF